jgi:hypothetical protein
MIIDITCRTDRFNLSAVGPHFINDCCFGEDFSRWLVGALRKNGVDASVLGMEDFGWSNQATLDGATYLVCVAGNSDEAPDNPDRGEWHVMLERKRSLMQRLTGEGKTSAADPLVRRIARVLMEAGLVEVGVEA